MLSRMSDRTEPSTGQPSSLPPEAMSEASHRRTAGTNVTMRDIATAAGVSSSTVSRVINDAPSSVAIGPATRERVEQAALRLGYRPNPFARALRGSRTMLIGAVVRDFSDPFFAGALEVLASEAMQHGYNVILGHARSGQGVRADLPPVIEPRHCDAVLMLGEMDDQPQLLAELRASNVPVVALWQGISPVRFPTVDVDDRAGTWLGLEHLVGIGHRRIGYVSAHLPGDNLTREEAYIEFMAGGLGGVPEGYLQRCENSLAGGEQALEAMLRLPEAPTAIACSTDLAAVGVLHGAYSHQIEVPAGLSVIGYDDLVFAAYTIPALTTLRMPTTEIVTEAVATAMKLVQEPASPLTTSRAVFVPTLIVRASTEVVPGATATPGP